MLIELYNIYVRQKFLLIVPSYRPHVLAFRFSQIALHVNGDLDRKSTRLNSSHANISYAVFCLKKKKNTIPSTTLLSTSNPISTPTSLTYFATLISSSLFMQSLYQLLPPFTVFFSNYRHALLSF